MTQKESPCDDLQKLAISRRRVYEAIMKRVSESGSPIVAAMTAPGFRRQVGLMPPRSLMARFLEGLGLLERRKIPHRGRVGQVVRGVQYSFPKKASVEDFFVDELQKLGLSTQKILSGIFHKAYKGKAPSAIIPKMIDSYLTTAGRMGGAPTRPGLRSWISQVKSTGRL